MTRRTALALDVGDARIGLAKGDTDSPFVFGRGFIKRRNQPSDIDELKQKMADEGADFVVVGLPRRSDGGDSKQTAKVRSFAEALRQAGIEVVFEDERYTTHLATQNIVQSGLPKQKRQHKGRVDEAAAVLILESYLAKLAHRQQQDEQSARDRAEENR